MEVKFIAFGAGQCSSVLPFILKEYDYIIFADTGWELPLTYEWVKIIAKTFPEKFIRIQTNMPKDLKTHPPICTKEFKILPIRRFLRKLGVTKAVKFLGITKEEKHRMVMNDVKWIVNEYPLLKLGFTRARCQQFLLSKFGFVPPRSGCIICKYFNRHHLINGIKINQKSILQFMV